MKKIALFLILASYGFADDITTIDGKVYKDAKILKADPDGLRVMWSDGVEKIPFDRLSKEIQDQYHYDPVAGKAFADQQKAALKAQVQASLIAMAQRPARLQSENANRPSSEDANHVSLIELRDLMDKVNLESLEKRFGKTHQVDDYADIKRTESVSDPEKEYYSELAHRARKMFNRSDGDYSEWLSALSAGCDSLAKGHAHQALTLLRDSRIKLESMK